MIASYGRLFYGRYRESLRAFRARRSMPRNYAFEPRKRRRATTRRSGISKIETGAPRSTDRRFLEHIVIIDHTFVSQFVAIDATVR